MQGWGGRLGGARARFSRSWTIFAAGFAALALVVAAGGTIQASGHVAQGVYVFGRDFGHIPNGDVPTAVSAAFEDRSRHAVNVRFADSVIPVKLADLGVSLDLAATTRRVLNAAADDGLGERLGRAFGRPPLREVAPVLSVDDSLLQKSVRLIAEALDRPSVDADVTVSPKGVVVRKAQTARKVDLSATAQRLRDHVVRAQDGDVEAAVGEVPPRVRDGDWAQVAEVVNLITSSPIELRHADRSWSLSPTDLAAALKLQPPGTAGQPASVQWDETKLAALLSDVARQIDVPGSDARVERTDGRFAVVGGVPGFGLNIPSTIAAIEAAAITAKRRINLAAGTVAPKVTAADWQDAVEVANRVTASPMRLTFRERGWTISTDKLAAALTFTRTAASAATFRVGLDEAELAKELRQVAKEIDRPARDARLKVIGDTVVVVSEAQEGLVSDVESTAASVSRHAFGNDRTVPFAVSSVAPKITAKDAANVSFPDLVSEATTSYAGSIPERAHNVELAAERLDGTLVPPDGVFSFNQSVGPTTLASGYQIGYGIALQGDQAVTVPSEAGGICQVATTVFQAAFWAGMPIVERLGHLYWISRYGTPPTGMVGLDATVDDPYVDFKFRNTTGGWLLVESSVDGANLKFTFRGRKPAWEVKVEGPAVWSVVKASSTAVRQEDPTLPKGQELWVEHAEDGFSAKVRRVVSEAGKTLDTLDVVSSYRPSQNVLLVGTKELTPTATLTSTAPITATATVTQPTVARP